MQSLLSLAICIASELLQIDVFIDGTRSVHLTNSLTMSLTVQRRLFLGLAYYWVTCDDSALNHECENFILTVSYSVI